MVRNDFAEVLPVGCPGLDADQTQRLGFWRFVMNAKWLDGTSIDELALSSQLGRGKPCPNGKDACDWASCSMFDEERTKKMRLIPPFKGKASVKFDIPANAGFSRLDRDGHLHLWRFAGFDLSKFVIEVDQ